jgi:2-oxoacid dehydrogenases acyltransferase (catalytic domain)
MYWPLESSPVSPLELGKYKCVYLSSCAPTPDPTIVWGTTVDMTGIDAFLQECNRSSSALITPAHVLLAAVGRAVSQHDCMRRRVVGTRVYRFKKINVAMPLANAQHGQIDILVLQDVDRRPVADIAGEMWQHNCEAAFRRAASRSPESQLNKASDGWSQLVRRVGLWFVLRLARMSLWLASRWNWPAFRWTREQVDVVALVNYFGFHGAPPITSYKPSRLPLNGMPLNVMLGPTEPQPVVVDGQVVVRPMASLFIRSDHRIADACELGRFTATLRNFLANPLTIEQQTENERPLLRRRSPHNDSPAWRETRRNGARLRCGTAPTGVVAERNP